MTAEHLRPDEALDSALRWKRWGPFLGERERGTVREDYSENGEVWNYFSHDGAHSCAFRFDALLHDVCLEAPRIGLPLDRLGRD
jgi:hypothetical protein